LPPLDHPTKMVGGGSGR